MNLEDRIKTSKFTVREGQYAKVGDFWKNIVFFWQHGRIYYITEGTATLIMKGKKLTLKPDHLYYIPANSVVSAECNVFLSHYYIHFECDQLQYNLFSAMNLTDETKGDELDLVLIKRVIALVNSPDNACTKNQMETNGIMQVLLSRFMDNKKNILVDSPRFMDILEYIDNNIPKKLTVSELAHSINYNVVYFSNTFKKQFGIPPSQYILNKKLSHSMFLLKNTDYSVKEIAYKIGFDDELYFSRQFKSKTGLSPRNFRSHAKKY